MLRSDLEALLALGDAVIIFGDLSSKSTNWNYSNRNGREMVALAEDFHFNIVTPLRPDILDIAVMKGVAMKLGCIDILQRLNSDHRPVLIRTVVEYSLRVITAKSSYKELPRDIRKMLPYAERANIPSTKRGPMRVPSNAK
ncbi:hypothetical protein EVAR_38542_1 [Eumeta japonica]|uniref:Endonuclease/exonuclease/phosphatase domain-containing protein n=1 Tax=Eumeta variegata TaxID=151549 RepID=A0A4C1WEH4_EUMVA|nr:hypothetical protein EVAR_38542_1 [Eumeta japonica]